MIFRRRFFSTRWQLSPPVLLVHCCHAEKVPAEGSRSFLAQLISLGSQVSAAVRMSKEDSQFSKRRLNLGLQWREKGSTKESPSPINSNNINCNDETRIDGDEKSKRWTWLLREATWRMLHLLIDVGLEGRKAEQSSSHKAMKRQMDIEVIVGWPLNKKLTSAQKKLTQEREESLRSPRRMVELNQRLHLKFTAALGTLGDHCKDSYSFEYAVRFI